MELILASASPRRRELLRQIGLTEFQVCPAQVDESLTPGLTPGAQVEAISAAKAAAVAAQHPDALVLAADTLVELDGELLGKPASPDHAREMLRRLSGRTHRVLTGMTVRRGERVVTVHQVTQVTFGALTPAEIEGYVATGEPLDKAGAYGIQGAGALLVERVQGDYFNVIGLPLRRLGLILREFGLAVPAR